MSARQVRDVIETLEDVLAMAEAGEIDGVMVVVRNRDGGNQCAAGGWYCDFPRDSLRYGVAAMVQLCDPATDEAASQPDESAQVDREHGSWLH